MRVTAARSGQSLGLGDRLVIEVVDVQILRRTVYGRRVTLDAEGEVRPRKQAQERGRREPPRDAKSAEKKVRAGKRKIEARGGGAKGKGGGKRRGR